VGDLKWNWMDFVHEIQHKRWWEKVLIRLKRKGNWGGPAAVFGKLKSHYRKI